MIIPLTEGVIRAGWDDPPLLCSLASYLGGGGSDYDNIAQNDSKVKTMAHHTVYITGRDYSTQVMPVGGSLHAQSVPLLSPNGVAAKLSTLMEQNQKKIPGLRLNYIPERSSEGNFQQVGQRIPAIVRNPEMPVIAPFRDTTNNSLVLGITCGEQTRFYSIKMGNSPMPYDSKHLDSNGPISKLLQFISDNYNKLWPRHQASFEKSFNDMANQFKSSLEKFAQQIQPTKQREQGLSLEA